MAEEQGPHCPPPLNRRRRRWRRIWRHLHAAQAAQRTRPQRPRLRPRRRRRRHLVLEPVPGRPVGHRELRLPLLVRRGTAQRMGLDPQVCDPARNPQYLEHVVDRYDLRKDIQLNTGITSAALRRVDRPLGHRHGHRRTITAKYIVNGLGLLSATNIPNIPGIDTLPGRDVPLRRLARGRGPDRQARRRHGHRLDRTADHHRHRTQGRTPHRLPALPAVQRPGRQHRLSHRSTSHPSRRTTARSGNRSGVPASPSGSRKAPFRR